MLGKRILFLLLSFGLQSTLAQDYAKQLSISEWISAMENSSGPYYYLSDTEIYFDEEKDSLYAWWQPRSPQQDSIPRKDIHINRLVVLENCKLPDNSTSVLSHLVFDKNVTFLRCAGASQLIFYDCTFKQGVDFNNSELGRVEFAYSSILQRVVISELQINVLSFSQCEFSTDASVPQSLFSYGFEQEDGPYQYLFRLTQNEKKISWFYMANCKILETDVKPVMLFNGGIYNVIYMEGIDFNEVILDFSACSVKENLTVQNCTFAQPLGADQFSFPVNNTSFYWKQLDSVGLGLYQNYATPPYTYVTDTLISDVYTFNALKSSYNKFFSMYRVQGDIESANAAYIQMKDMETGKYRYLYQKEPGLQSWFNWRFNQFLKYFSAYGTSPVQSLIFSMWTILIFAALYFFFPSDWDQINRTFLINEHRKIMQYFRTEQRLEDFYTEKHKEHFKTFEEYKAELGQGRAELPAFILLVGKPLYLLSGIKHRFLTFIYRRIEVLKGKWIDLNPMRKAYLSFLTILTILIYSFYLIIIRVLNSVALSINVFSTLGFGAIPVGGITRYITIIEGFLGWFLLSIFSVSLISQMLQN